MKILILTFLFFVSCLTKAQDELDETNSEPLRSSRQLIVVLTKDWNTISGQLLRFERPDDKSAWKKIEPAFPVVVGRNGLGWGKGLALAKNVKAPLKKEGDGKSPAGMFRLSSVFGLAEPEKTKWLKLPYVHLTSTIECVDDVKSTRYNSMVDRQNISKTDWSSSEKMREIGEQYRWGIVVDHNVNPRVAGDGSCIFLHIWKDAETGTSGCTAMTLQHIESLLYWLDASLKPVLVQLPEAEYKQRRKEWNLPDLAARPRVIRKGDRELHKAP